MTVPYPGTAARRRGQPSLRHAAGLAFTTSPAVPRTVEIGIAVLETQRSPRQQRRRTGHDGCAGLASRPAGDAVQRGGTPAATRQAEQASAAAQAGTGSTAAAAGRDPPASSGGDAGEPTGAHVEVGAGIVDSGQERQPARFVQGGSPSSGGTGTNRSSMTTHRSASTGR